jgi:hypothetical protein
MGWQKLEEAGWGISTCCDNPRVVLAVRCETFTQVLALWPMLLDPLNLGAPLPLSSTLLVWLLVWIKNIFIMIRSSAAHPPKVKCRLPLELKPK